MLRYARFLLVLALFSSWAQASLFDRLGEESGPLPVDQAYLFSAQEEAPGRYRLEWTITEDYYLYRDKIKLSPPEGVEVVEVRKSPAVEKDDPLFGLVPVYYESAVVQARLQSATGVGGTLEVEYQGCWEGGICYPPVTREVELPALPPEAAAFVSADANNAEASASSDSAWNFSLTDQRGFVDALSASSIWLVLGLFFVAGLALSLTPCVLPMIPILAGVIAGQGQPVSGQRGFWLALVYVLSMSLTYTAAGVFAGVFGENLQAALQTPWIIILFSLVFVGLAGAMFGWYQLQMPTGVQAALSRLSRSQRGGQVSGVAVMGFLSALIVGPCVAAPLAGALLYIGQAGDPLLGGLALFVLSLGMGLPLLLVGASAGRLLPRAGSWMNQVKGAFGFVLLFMAVWMLDRILAPQVIMLLAGSLLVILAIFMRALDNLPPEAGSLSRLGKGVGLLLLIYGGALLVGAAAGNRSILQPLEGMARAETSVETRDPLADFAQVSSRAELVPVLDAAAREGRPVMLDFYADWCVSCKELESFVFADKAVQQEFERFQLVRVDVTAHDAAAKALYRQYQIVGPPALIFYGPKGDLLPEHSVIGVPDSLAFAEHLRGI